MGPVVRMSVVRMMDDTQYTSAAGQSADARRRRIVSAPARAGRGRRMSMAAWAWVALSAAGATIGASTSGVFPRGGGEIVPNGFMLLQGSTHVADMGRWARIGGSANVLRPWGWTRSQERADDAPAVVSPTFRDSAAVPAPTGVWRISTCQRTLADGPLPDVRPRCGGVLLWSDIAQPLVWSASGGSVSARLLVLGRIWMVPSHVRPDLLMRPIVPPSAIGRIDAPAREGLQPRPTP